MNPSFIALAGSPRRMSTVLAFIFVGIPVSEKLCGRGVLLSLYLLEPLNLSHYMQVDSRSSCLNDLKQRMG